MFVLIVILFSSPSSNFFLRSWEILHNTAGASAAIPIGIAVGRQRLQETQSTPQIQAKDLNRFGFGLDLGE